MRLVTLNLLIVFLFLTGPLPALAEEQKQPQGPPPMLVEVAQVGQGAAEPMVELVGSVQYGRVSRVAAEVGGIVEQIQFSEGARVKAGQPLVKLRSDLLQTNLEGTRASYEQVLIELERARKDLQRIAALYREKSVAETSTMRIITGSWRWKSGLPPSRRLLTDSSWNCRKPASPPRSAAWCRASWLKRGNGCRPAARWR
jgi:multidrug efflux pump subunit AcrA (membrane-fusion protein)